MPEKHKKDFFFKKSVPGFTLLEQLHKDGSVPISFSNKLLNPELSGTKAAVIKDSRDDNHDINFTSQGIDFNTAGGIDSEPKIVEMVNQGSYNNKLINTGTDLPVLEVEDSGYVIFNQNVKLLFDNDNMPVDDNDLTIFIVIEITDSSINNELVRVYDPEGQRAFNYVNEGYIIHRKGWNNMLSIPSENNFIVFCYKNGASITLKTYLNGVLKEWNQITNVATYNGMGVGTAGGFEGNFMSLLMFDELLSDSDIETISGNLMQLHGIQN